MQKNSGHRLEFVDPTHLGAARPKNVIRKTCGLGFSPGVRLIVIISLHGWCR